MFVVSKTRGGPAARKKSTFKEGTKNEGSDGKNHGGIKRGVELQPRGKGRARSKAAISCRGRSSCQRKNGGPSNER